MNNRVENEWRFDFNSTGKLSMDSSSVKTSDTSLKTMLHGRLEWPNGAPKMLVECVVFNDKRINCSFDDFNDPSQSISETKITTKPFYNNSAFIGPLVWLNVFIAFVELNRDDRQYKSLIWFDREIAGTDIDINRQECLLIGEDFKTLCSLQLVDSMSDELFGQLDSGLVYSIEARTEIMLWFNAGKHSKFCFQNITSDFDPKVIQLEILYYIHVWPRVLDTRGG